MLRFCSAAGIAASSLALVPSVCAQATYVNFETPQVKPIAVAVVGGTEFLLVCNTPDSSVEIYDPNTALPSTAPTFLARVPVGQGPASVRYDANTECFYTANYIGDSVTKVQLTNLAGLQWQVIATKPAGEAPADLALSADGLTLFVTLADASMLASLDSTTLDPVAAPTLMTAATGSATLGLKEPRRIEVQGTATWVLNMKGGNTHAPHSPPSPAYDFDIWTTDPSVPSTRFGVGLGTTNAGMAWGPDGLLYVVGSMARNDIADEANLQALALTGTGFVESWLWIVTPGGTAPAASDARNLNLSAAGVPITSPRTCSQPMDVVLKTESDEVTKVYIATFASDRLVVLTPNAGSAATWTRTLINLPITPVTNDYSRNGPRGLAMNAAQTRLYCMNQLSNSVSVVDLSTDTEAIRFDLQWDMTPRVVREGRRFLYSAEFSGNGTVSCSSCHVDARTDSLGWDLGTPGITPIQHPIGLDDVIADPDNPPNFDADKGIMVTQSLQGLVNHPMNVVGQDFFSNKPYHWRGDRADFIAFNGAFVDLMGATDLNPTGPAMGLTSTQMTRYRDFINTVMYTPNPEQAPEREFRGSLGLASDFTSGSDAMRGLKVFHMREKRCGGRSCVQCHFLPEGSNNRITETSAGGVETAAMRSLFQREGRAEPPAAAGTVGLSNIFTTHFGLVHDGRDHAAQPTNPNVSLVDAGPASIDRFVLDNFGAFPTLADFQQFEDLVKFCREMDAGIAPAIGISYTVTSANKALTPTTDVLDLLEEQVRKANIGFAIYAHVGGTPFGVYFDISGATEGYRVHGTATLVTRATMLAAVGAGDILVLQGTPAGSERRIASLTGAPGTLTGSAPANVTLQPLRPATHWVPIPQFLGNWDPFASTNPFVWTGTDPTPQSLKSVRLLQRALIQFAPGYGLTVMRHEAPRRFAVAGDNIRLGARLQIRVPAPTTPGTPPPYVDVGANTILLDMGLYPTDQFVSEKRVWETTVEADPLLIYTLVLGGPSATGVAAAVNTPHLVTETTSYAPGTFDPLRGTAST
jgi:DNA-binding beta-propeller fold protein YncE